MAGALTQAQVREMVSRYFGDLGPQVVDVMTAVAMRESGGVVSATGDNYRSGHQSATSPARYDYGLFQINSQHGFDPDRLRRDPVYNIQAARKIYDAQGPQAWSTYNLMGEEGLIGQLPGGGGPNQVVSDQSILNAINTYGQNAPSSPRVEYDGSGRAYRWEQPAAGGAPSLVRVPQLDQQNPGAMTQQDMLNFGLDVQGFREGQRQFDLGYGLEAGRLGLSREEMVVAAQTAQRNYDLAVRNQNFAEASYQQNRLDTLQQMYDQFELNEKSADRQRTFLSGESALDRGFQGQQSALDRGLTASEGAANRGLTVSENALNRSFQGQESALDRAIRASEFAATHGLALKGDARAEAESIFNRKRALNQDKLGAASQYANVISSTDPAALPAFFQAGGGNISNALASGATALSENSMLPAARTLQAIDGIDREIAAFGQQQQAPQQGGTFNQYPMTTAQHWANGTAGVATGDTPWSPDYQRQVQARIDTQAGNIAGNAVRGNYSYVSFDPAVQQRLAGMGIRDAGTQLQGAVDSGKAGFTYDPYTGLVDKRVPTFARGGSTSAPVFIAGDEMGDRDLSEGQPELIEIDYANRRARVTPLEGGGGQGVPRYAGGTPVAPVAPVYNQSLITPAGGGAANIDPLTGLPTLTTEADRPYLDRVRALREGVQFPQLNPFDVQYSRQAPTIRELFLRGRQSKFGLPVQDQMAEIDRYSLAGTQRGAYRVAR